MCNGRFLLHPNCCKESTEHMHTIYIAGMRHTMIRLLGHGRSSPLGRPLGRHSRNTEYTPALGLYIYGLSPFRLLPISPTKCPHFAYSPLRLLPTSPTPHFAYSPFRLLPTSPTPHFAYPHFAYSPFLLFIHFAYSPMRLLPISPTPHSLSELNGVTMQYKKELKMLNGE
jgi:hypothetical protein